MCQESRHSYAKNRDIDMRGVNDSFQGPYTDCPDVVWNTCSPQGIIKDIWQKALEQKSEIGAKEWRLTMAKVLKLATFPVARKRESKRALRFVHL